MSFPFLSDEWFSAMEALQAEMPDLPPGADELLVNLIVTNGPGGNVHAHLANGRIVEGHADGAPSTVTAPYDVAKTLILMSDQMAIAKSFMSGKIKITGDVTKLISFAELAASPDQLAFAQRIASLTA